MKMEIVTLERNVADGLVTVVHWTATETDGDFTASAYGSIGVPAKDTKDPTFIPYKNITKAKAIEWVEEAMGEEKVAALEANLKDQIKVQKNPVSATGLPWADSL